MYNRRLIFVRAHALTVGNPKRVRRIGRGATFALALRRALAEARAINRSGKEPKMSEVISLPPSRVAHRRAPAKAASVETMTVYLADRILHGIAAPWLEHTMISVRWFCFVDRHGLAIVRHGYPVLQATAKISIVGKTVFQSYVEIAGIQEDAFVGLDLLASFMSSKNSE